MKAAAGAARMFPIAIDYRRFSNPEQEQGDSKRRQKSRADAWSARTGVPIDLRLSDDGASGFSRQDRRLTDDTYALARFLKMIQTGGVQPGDYLLVENFDRLSRDKEVRATNLLTSILGAGVKIVQLVPDEFELTEDSDAFSIMRAVMELSRGRGESLIKHIRCSDSYANNRREVAAGQEFYQGSLPAWLRREGRGKGARHRAIVKIPERVEVVERIFDLAALGHGYTAIVRKLVADGVPPFGQRVALIDPRTGRQASDRRGRLRWQAGAGGYGKGAWTRSYVQKILKDRTAMGRMPTKGGEVLPVPAAVTEEQWLAAQAGRGERDRFRGRTCKAGPVNLFSGLLTDADNGEGFFVASWGKGGKEGGARRVLLSSAAKQGGPSNSFPEPAFERAVRLCLKEIDPAEVTRREGPDRAAVVAGRLEEVADLLKGYEAELLAGGPKSKTLMRVVAKLEEEQAALLEEQRQARHEEARPLSESWGQARTLAELPDTPDNRLRLRSLLRRLVEEIRVLIVPRGWDRVALLQMYFRESEETRLFLVAYLKDVMPTGRRASRRRRERGEDRCAVRSYRDDEPLDLREPAHCAAARAELLALDLASL